MSLMDAVEEVFDADGTMVDARGRAWMDHPICAALLLVQPVPCISALDWALTLVVTMTLEQAWTVCPRADWLVWLAGSVDESCVLDSAFLAIGRDLGFVEKDEDCDESEDEGEDNTPWDVAMNAVEGDYAFKEEHQEALFRAADMVREHIPWSALAPLLPRGAS